MAGSANKTGKAIAKYEVAAVQLTLIANDNDLTYRVQQVSWAS